MFRSPFHAAVANVGDSMAEVARTKPRRLPQNIRGSVKLPRPDSPRSGEIIVHPERVIEE